MTIKTYNHLNPTHAQDVKEICSPLEHLNITYFAHVHIDKDRKFSSISNNPDFHEHYIKKEYFNADIHMSNDSNLGNYIIWDAIDCYGESAEMNKEAEEFGIRHSFTIVDKKNTGKNYYHFATNTPEKAINQIYLNKIDLLKLFILNFNEKIQRSPLLSQAHQIKYAIDDKPSDILFSTNEIICEKDASSAFMQAMKMQLSTKKADLTLRELEILSWLYKGKTICQVAEILDIKSITVKKHIANIKDKTDSYTQFQLGSYFSRLISS